MARPRCITYSMASVDGRLTIAPGVNLMAGDPRWEAATAGLGDPYDWIRREHDPQVLLEGSGSFISPTDPVEPADPAEPADSDPATDRDLPPPEGEHFLPADVVTAAGRRWFAVVDGPGRVDLQFTEWPDPAWAGWHAIVLTIHAAPEEHLTLLRSRGIPYFLIGEHHVDLAAAMRLLGEHLGVSTVVCTGGGRLGGAMLRAGLVDEIDIDVLPVAIGGRGTPALFDAPTLSPDEWPVALDLMSAESLDGGIVRLRYSVRISRS